MVVPSVAENRKSYRQFCGVARALDRLGERWTLLIVRNLLLGPRRYSDFLEELPGITTNLLAKRLREMSATGLIQRVAGAGALRGPAYELTALGAALEPVVMELGRWGGRFLDKPAKGDTLNIGWALLSLKRRYLGGQSLTAGFRIGERAFELSLRPSYLAVTEHEPLHVDIWVEGPLGAFQRWLLRGEPAQALRDKKALTVHGDDRAWQILTASFAPPPRAA